jgi:predicted molibdopterin-dependent oxidoreductase YjgC
MSGDSFNWAGQQIAFRPGETIAAALAAADIHHLGPDGQGRSARYFCGIGACQGCLVQVDGMLREACLTTAKSGLNVSPSGASHV